MIAVSSLFYETHIPSFPLHFALRKRNYNFRKERERMKTFRFSKVRPTAQICTPFYTRDIPVQIGTHFLPSLVSPRMIFELKFFFEKCSWGKRRNRVFFSISNSNACTQELNSAKRQKNAFSPYRQKWLRSHAPSLFRCFVGVFLRV